MLGELKINFPPRFASRWGYERENSEHIEKIFVAKQAEQLAFIKAMGAFAERFNAIPTETEIEKSPRWKQGWFPPLDGMSTYTVAGHYKPKTIFEIGSGNSTKFFNQAKIDLNLDAKLISVDPHPREEIDVICDEIFRIPLEDMDLGKFDILKPGDVLFFDGSHRSFQNSDVSVFFIDILPRLSDGVIVGIHDIFWPVDYPPTWVDRYYNEQYLLAAYMLGFGIHFPLIFSCSYAWRNLPEEIHAVLPTELVNRVERVSGGCIWFEKRSVSGLIPK